MEIRIAYNTEFKEIQDFYSEMDYDYDIIPSDVIIIAIENKIIIGVARLCKEFNILVLRGMEIRTRMQRKGIGTKLLLFINKEIGDNTCFCIPYMHLEHFYSRIGFKRINVELSPPHLIQRLNEYKKSGPDMIIMKKN